MNQQRIADAAEALGQDWFDNAAPKLGKMPEAEQALAMAMAGVSVAVSCLMALNSDRAASQRVLDAIVKAVMDDVEIDDE